MGEKELTALTNVKAKTVGLVKRGANKKRRFPIYKGDDMDLEMKEILEAVLDTEIDEEAELSEWFEKAKISDKAKNAVKGMLRMANAFKDELPKDVLDKLASIAGYPAPKRAQKKPEDEEEEEYPGPKKAKKPEEEQKPMKKSDEDAVPEAIQKQLDDAKAETVALQKALDDEKRSRKRTELVAKCEKEFAHVPGLSVDEMATMLLDADDDARELLEKQWAATEEAVVKSELLSSHGSGGALSDGGDAWAQIEKLADQFVEKSAGELTKQKAVERVLKTKRGQELYRQYEAENPKQYT